MRSTILSAFYQAMTTKRKQFVAVDQSHLQDKFVRAVVEEVARNQFSKTWFQALSTCEKLWFLQDHYLLERNQICAQLKEVLELCLETAPFVSVVVASQDDVTIMSQVTKIDLRAQTQTAAQLLRRVGQAVGWEENQDPFQLLQMFKKMHPKQLFAVQRAAVHLLPYLLAHAKETLQQHLSAVENERKRLSDKLTELKCQSNIPELQERLRVATSKKHEVQKQLEEVDANIVDEQARIMEKQRIIQLNKQQQQKIEPLGAALAQQFCDLDEKLAKIGKQIESHDYLSFRSSWNVAKQPAQLVSLLVMLIISQSKSQQRIQWLGEPTVQNFLNKIHFTDRIVAHLIATKAKDVADGERLAAIEDTIRRLLIWSKSGKKPQSFSLASVESWEQELADTQAEISKTHETGGLVFKTAVLALKRASLCFKQAQLEAQQRNLAITQRQHGEHAALLAAHLQNMQAQRVVCQGRLQNADAVVERAKEQLAQAQLQHAAIVAQISETQHEIQLKTQQAQILEMQKTRTTQTAIASFLLTQEELSPQFFQIQQLLKVLCDQQLFYGIFGFETVQRVVATAVKQNFVVSQIEAPGLQYKQLNDRRVLQLKDIAYIKSLFDDPEQALAIEQLGFVPTTALFLLTQLTFAKQNAIFTTATEGQIEAIRFFARLSFAHGFIEAARSERMENLCVQSVDIHKFADHVRQLEDCHQGERQVPVIVEGSIEDLEAIAGLMFGRFSEENGSKTYVLFESPPSHSNFPGKAAELMKTKLSLRIYFILKNKKRQSFITDALGVYDLASLPKLFTGATFSTTARDGYQTFDADDQNGKYNQKSSNSSSMESFYSRAQLGIRVVEEMKVRSRVSGVLIERLRRTLFLKAWEGAGEEEFVRALVGLKDEVVKAEAAE